MSEENRFVAVHLEDVMRAQREKGAYRMLAAVYRVLGDQDSINRVAQISIEELCKEEFS